MSAGPAGGPAPTAAASIAYEETRVGRLPLGPAGDAAIAAAAAQRAEPPARARSSDVLDLGAASRGALVKRVVPLASRWPRRP